MMFGFMRSVLGNLLRNAEGGSGGGAGGSPAINALTGGGDAGNNGADGAGAAGGAAGAGSAGAQNGDPWFSGLDQSYHAAITAKGWDKLDAAGATKALADSYFNLEKLIGHDKAGRAIVPPKEGAPQAEVDAFYAKLGRPEKPDGYDFKLDQNAPKEFADAAAAEFHKAGLTKAQGDALGAWYQSQIAQQSQAFQAQSENEYRALQAEFGARLPDAEEAGRRAVKAFGLEPEALGKIEQAIGTSAMMKMFINAGERLLEAPSPGKSSSNSAIGGLTPATAQAKITELYQNSEFMAKMTSPNSEVRNPALAQIEELQKIAAGV